MLGSTIEPSSSTHVCQGEIRMQETLQRKSGWSQTYTIWLLIVLSLLPGGLIALDRELWTGLPAGVRAATYLTSALLIAAACALILLGGKKQEDS
jgi:uncharacterized membrane protein YhiD involved in acid resistance